MTAPATGAARIRPLARAAERVALACLLLAALLVPLWGGGGPPAARFALRVLVALAASGWLLAGALQRRLWLPPQRLLAPLALYGAALALSAARSPYPWGALQGLTEALSYPLAFLATAGLVGLAGGASEPLRGAPRARRLLLGVVLGVAVLLGAYGLLQAVGLDWTPRAPGSGTRIASSYHLFSHYGGLLTLLTPLALACALAPEARPRTRAAAAALTLLLALNLLLTRSWDGVAVTAVACAALALHWALRPGATPGRRRLAALAAVALPLAAAALLWGAAPRPPATPGGPVKSQGAVLRERLLGKLQGRLALYRGAWALFEDAPLLGHGPASFGFVYPRHRPADARRFAFLHRDVTYAHNDPLQVASEAGGLGALGFLGFWLALLTLPGPHGGAGQRSGPGSGPGSGPDAAVRRGLRAGLTALLVAGLFDAHLTVVPATALLGWMLAGVLTGMLAGEPTGGAGDADPR